MARTVLTTANLEDALNKKDEALLKMHFWFDKDRRIDFKLYGDRLRVSPAHFDIPVRWEEGEEAWGEHVFWFEVDMTINDKGEPICLVGLYRYNEADIKVYQVITEDTFFDIISGIDDVIDFNKCECKHVLKATVEHGIINMVDGIKLIDIPKN